MGRAASRRVGAREIAVRNDLESLDAVRAAVEAFVGEAAIPDPARRSLLLIAEEFFTNTVRHGYGQGTEDEIAVSLARDGDRVVLVFRDRARPFDITALPPAPPAGTPVADMKVGGLGLVLIHEVCQSLAWRRQDGVNISELCIVIDSA